MKEESSLRRDYFTELGKAFREAETQENAEALFDIFYIYKNIVTYGEQKVLETLLSDEFYLEMFGAFERKLLLLVGDPSYLNQDLDLTSENEQLIEEELNSEAEPAEKKEVKEK